MRNTHSDEIQQGQRFQFGANWKAFLSTINEERIHEAEESLKKMLGVDILVGKKFLDIGSGSGLFSLAAKRLGASVHSFDFDPQSVACTRELKRRFFNGDNGWCIEEGSVLDERYMASLGVFDIVYSWGVLHHTGEMNTALENAMIPVSDDGYMFIAIYNDQDLFSQLWQKIKKIYNLNKFGKVMICSSIIPFLVLQCVLIGLIKYKNPIGYFLNYKKKRGMSVFHDWIDWLGGYPFEVAKPEVIFNYFKKQGYALVNMITTNRLGCNEFVFKKDRIEYKIK